MIFTSKCIKKKCFCSHLFNCVINFCTKLFYKFHKLLQYKCLESKLSLAKDVMVNPWPSLKHSWVKVLKPVHENIYICLFPCLTSSYKRSRSTQGHYLNNLGITGLPDAALSMPYWLIGSGEDFESILNIFKHEGHVCHVTSTV